MLAQPNKERIQLWIDALRSGEFKQGKFENYIPDADSSVPGTGSYCCLGVACAVAERNGAPILDVPWRTHGTLPAKVRAWFGIPDSNPYLGVDPGKGYLHATHVNDHLNWTFDQIADAVERRFIKEENDGEETS